MPLVDSRGYNLVPNVSPIAQRIGQALQQKAKIQREDEMIAKKEKVAQVKDDLLRTANHADRIRDIKDPVAKRTEIARIAQQYVAEGKDASMWTDLLQEQNPDALNLGLTRVFTATGDAGEMFAQSLKDDTAATGGKIGTYNPRDYSSDSWAKYVQTRDPSVLERYTEKTVDIGGVPHRLIAGTTNQYEPIKTTEEVAESEAQIVAAKETARLKAETLSAPDLKFAEKLGAEGGAIYSKLQKAAQDASTFVPRLKSLAKLADKVKTGTGAEIKMLAKRALGVDSANMEVLNARLGELAQDILNQQTGTKTDFDFQNAVRQSASLGKTPAANALLIQALIDRQKQAIDFGNQAKKAYKRGGPQAVLDMRYQSPVEQAPTTQAVETVVPQSVETYEQRRARLLGK